MKTATKQISDHAHAAKLIRAYCKKLGIKCTARSSIYSMGSSVHAEVFNQPPQTYKKIKEYCDQFQQGHFDGMQDMYEYSNSRDDIPQVKYSFINNKFDDDFKQLAWDFLHSLNICDMENMSKTYKDLPSYITGGIWGHQPQDLVYRTLNNSIDCTVADQNFWTWYESKQPTTEETPTEAPEINCEGFEVSQHTHTKRGFNMFIASLTTKISKDDFKSMLDVARSFKGWYSRQWGSTPAGFAFKDMDQVNAFIEATTGPTEPTEPTDPTEPTGPAKPKQTPTKLVLLPQSNNKLIEAKAAKLEKLADGMQKLIDDKQADRAKRTPRQLKQAQQAKLEGLKLARAQGLLYSLSLHILSNSVPMALENITTKKQALELMSSKLELVSNGYHGYYVDQGEPATDTPQTRAAWAMIQKSKFKGAEDPIQRKIDGLRFAKIPGYFPTPDNIISRMIEHANIQPGQSILEPSAGSGSILNQIKKTGVDCELKCIEFNYTLSEILTGLGYNCINGDFIQLEIKESYDVVLMNPPFENSADMTHITKALKLLKPGGTLVAICSEGVFFREDKTTQTFRKEILDNYMVESEKLHNQEFKESGTNVNTRLIVLKN